MDELADVAVAAREIEKLRAKKERERKLAAARKAKQREPGFRQLLVSCPFQVQIVDVAQDR